MLIDTLCDRVIYTERYCKEADRGAMTYKSTADFMELLRKTLTEENSLKHLVCELINKGIEFTFSESEFNEIKIGILDKNTYHWFIFGGNTNIFFFDHSFNAGSGKKTKGVAHRIKVKCKYNYMLKKEIF